MQNCFIIFEIDNTERLKCILYNVHPPSPAKMQNFGWQEASKYKSFCYTIG